jgi:hypothetical protein
MVIVGPILDTIVVSHAVVVGTSCEESERHVNMGSLRLLLHLEKGPSLCLLSYNTA